MLHSTNHCIKQNKQSKIPFQPVLLRLTGAPFCLDETDCKVLFTSLSFCLFFCLMVCG